MYIEKTISGYDRHGEQVARRARFLLLFSGEEKDPVTGKPVLYACVRRVALHQFGHFMMGRANIGGRWHSVSGSYGADGLTKTWTSDLAPYLTRVPTWLAWRFWTSDGWNSAGSEGPLVREWAIHTFR